MSYVLPSNQQLNDLIQRSLSIYIEGHILNYYAVDYIEDLTHSQIQEVVATYFNEKSARLESPIVSSLYALIDI
jgi:hypothetical protein